MKPQHSYLELNHHPVVSIVKGVDKDVEYSEDILMLGYIVVLMAPLFAPIAPPKILLPLMALCFILSVCFARQNVYRIQQKFNTAIAMLEQRDLSALQPIMNFFKVHPQYTLADGFNPLKNPVRTVKSFLGGVLLNPLWMPIFYALSLQFAEDSQLTLLNQAVITVENQVSTSIQYDE